MADSKDIFEVLKSAAPHLLSIPHVLGVDVGNKIVAGIETNELSIRVKVAVKLPKEELPQKYLIPSTIEGYPVDIIEERSELANAVLRAATYDQLSRESSQRPIFQSKSLETSDLPDRFRSYVDLLLKGWLIVTVVSSLIALIFIIIGIWSLIKNNILFTTFSGGVTIIDFIALGILKPWQKYQRALLDERIIEKATSVLNDQLKDLRDSDKSAEELNQLRNQYMSSWLKSVDRQ